MKPKLKDHIRLIPNDKNKLILLCENCGEEFSYSFPIGFYMFEGIAKGFKRQHRNCVKK